MEFDFLQLKFLIKRKFKSQELLAKELNISGTALCNKLNNRVPFNFFEVYKLINLLEINNEEVKEIFFTEKVSN